ncbi:MAG: IS4 family transposase [Acidobacteria bacterium]|nr:IS4 family transposase [Acidobacteriota bacterium]
MSVGDRASDIYGYFRQSQELGWEVVARAVQDRVIHDLSGERQHLMQWSRQLSAAATKEVTLRGRDGKPKRTVNLQVAWGQCDIQSPHEGKERFGPPLRVSVVRCWEVDPPAGQQALEWILITSLSVHNADQALMIIEWYEHRWLIEEYHKCLKTGCAIEQRQLTTAQALQACLGFSPSLPCDCCNCVKRVVENRRRSHVTRLNRACLKPSNDTSNYHQLI